MKNIKLISVYFYLIFTIACKKDDANPKNTGNNQNPLPNNTPLVLCPIIENSCKPTLSIDEFGLTQKFTFKGENIENISFFNETTLLGTKFLKYDNNQNLISSYLDFATEKQDYIYTYIEGGIITKLIEISDYGSGVDTISYNYTYDVKKNIINAVYKSKNKTTDSIIMGNYNDCGRPGWQIDFTFSQNSIVRKDSILYSYNSDNNLIKKIIHKFNVISNIPTETITEDYTYSTHPQWIIFDKDLGPSGTNPYLRGRNRNKNLMATKKYNSSLGFQQNEVFTYTIKNKCISNYKRKDILTSDSTVYEYKY